VFRRTAFIGVALVLLSAAAVLAPSAGAVKPCPVEYCTDSKGEYVLTVPPLPANHPLYGPYADCVWNAYVDFGDGTNDVYLFDAAVGLTGSHVFPTRGRLYLVNVYLREGQHAQTKEPCFNYNQTAEVLYRTAAEEADDPPPDPEEEEPEPEPEKPAGPAGGGGTTPAPPAVAAGSATPEATPAPAPEPQVFWKRCRGGVLTHLVGCRKGRAVAKAAGAKLGRPGTVQASGFSCRLPRGSATAIVCRRGEQGVISPLGGGRHR
jgi:hypothetical protein